MEKRMNGFLDWMDSTRNMRTQGRTDAWMMNGYRKEWNRYIDEYYDDNADRR